MKKHIETERLILREWEDEDLEPFARMNADPLVMEYLPRVLDEKASARHMQEFQKHFDKYGYGLYVVEVKEDDEFAGFVGLKNVDFKAAFTPAIELAWRLDYEHWGKGYASEAARAVIDHAFTVLSLTELVAYTVHDNVRTIAMMEKLGMEYQKGEDFDYPALRKGHPLGRFVLYKIEK
ncbi:MAG: GNAT family N-acetyltransferase [Alphaproteobacteria bacterium]|nr:GNAT family N-acetyltransferase [Alphaproteobacteria bacterium]